MKVNQYPGDLWIGAICLLRGRKGSSQIALAAADRVAVPSRKAGGISLAGAAIGDGHLSWREGALGTSAPSFLASVREPFRLRNPQML